MDRAARVVAAIPGVLFAVNGLRWLVAPESAAEGLGLPFPDGVGRSTMIGDLGAFFFAASAMILVGAVTAQRRWLLASAGLLGCAAAMRLVAWLFHGAALATTFIAIELVVVGVLVFAARTLRPKPGAAG